MISTTNKNIENKLKKEATVFVYSNIFDRENWNENYLESKFVFTLYQFDIFKEVVEQFNKMSEEHFEYCKIDENVLTVGKLLELLQNVKNKNAVVSFFDENSMDSYSFDGIDLDKSKKFATIKIKL